jgi:predicted enzyme related to lactoylglutathione lyase
MIDVRFDVCADNLNAGRSEAGSRIVACCSAHGAIEPLTSTKPRIANRSAIAVYSLERRLDVVDYPGRFAWYELMTTDIASAKAFYAKVVGWGAQDASAPGLAYTLFTSGKVPVSGLMALPEEATRMGATPRWMGYVSVDDVGAVTDRLKRLGGAVYVPPTDSNIGRISVVADPQTATLALVQGLNVGQAKLIEPNKPGRIGWHELLAADRERAFAFYGELFDWQKADSEPGSATPYQLFSVGGETVGGIFNKRPREPVPFWLYYFNVGDIDAAVERVESGGGEVFEGPLELPGGGWIARCRDPQGAAFAIQGKRSQDGIGRAPVSEVGWSTAWGGISTKGRMVVTAPRGRGRTSDTEE